VAARSARAVLAYSCGVIRLVSSRLALLSCLALGCGAPASSASDSSGTSEVDEDSGSQASGESGTSASTAGADDDGDGSDSAAATSETMDGTGGDAPEPTMLPTPTGTCPELVDGDVTFSPAGIEPRDVRLWMSDAAATMDGPLVFHWHGTGSQPLEAQYGLGAKYIDQVVAQGGIIAAPHHDPAAGQFPWFLVAGTQEDDLLLADEVLACAIEQLGVDTRRIHTIGMSAGGLQTAQFSVRRSGYIASAVPYSGGFIGPIPADQDPSNPLAAMIFHGGESDVVIVGFQEASERYRDALQAADRFAFICDHGMGHTIPQGAAQASVWQFFLDHPYGTQPSPYAAGLPAGFPEYCAL
jgi:predicted esterase